MIDRHEAFVASEVARVLRYEGRFVTQQVGGRNLDRVSEVLGVPFPYSAWTLDACCGQLEAAGLTVVDRREGFMEVVFADLASLVSYLENDPWQVTGRTLPRSARALERLVRRLPLRARHHRFYVEAVRA